MSDRTNARSSVINQVIDIIFEAEGKNLRPRVLYCKVKNDFVPIAEVYSRSMNEISKKIRNLLGRNTYYQAVQLNELELIKNLGHSVALSIYQYAKVKSQYRNRVIDMTTKEMSSVLGIKYRTALRGVRELESNNVLIRVGSGKDTAYYLNPAYAHKGRLETHTQTAKLFIRNVKNTQTTPNGVQEERVPPSSDQEE